MIKKVILIILLFSIYIGLSSQLYFYDLNEFEPEIIDARAESLGRTSILSSAGANFIFNNPAMLGNLTTKNVQFSGRTLFGNYESKSKTDGEIDKYKLDYPLHIKFNGFAFSMPYNFLKSNNLEIGIGVGYRTYYDWGFNIHHEDDEDSDYEEEVTLKGGLSTIVLGGGFKFQKRFFGGASISFPFLSNYLHKYENTQDYESEMEGNMKGSFFTLSGSYIVNKKIIIGARLRTSFRLNIEGENDNGTVYESDYIIPAEFGLAIEMKPNEKFKLYAEYLTRGFGDYEIETDYGDYDYYNDSDNGFSFRTGFEVGTINVIRGGLFMQSVPIYELKYIYDDWDAIFNDEPEKQIGLTAGFGVNIKNISLDFYGSYSFLNYNENFEYSSDQVLNDYYYSRIKIGCSMGYSL